jgi:hypothetical protein
MRRRRKTFFKPKKLDQVKRQQVRPLQQQRVMETECQGGKRIKPTPPFKVIQTREMKKATIKIAI